MVFPQTICAYNARYVDSLLQEIEALRDSRARPGTPDGSSLVPDATDTHGTQITRNPLIEEQPWFQSMPSLDGPIHIGEASDSGFATRFRQTVANVYTDHLPRTSFVRDGTIMALSESDFKWPSPARARFLVEVALNTVGRYYHIVRKSVVLKSLEEAIIQKGKGDGLKISKLMALFALGEAYSARSVGEPLAFPGLAYFAHSKKMVSIPSERPQIDTIEVALLLVCSPTLQPLLF